MIARQWAEFGNKSEFEIEKFDDEFEMHEKYFKLHEIYDIYQAKDQLQWGQFFSSSKSYFIKPAILVKKASEVVFEVQKIEDLPEKNTEDKKKEIENMFL